MGTEIDRHFIEHMTWDEVTRQFANGAAATVPIGAAATQRGFIRSVSR
jgi:creatinine amidohydrolase